MMDVKELSPYERFLRRYEWDFGYRLFQQIRIVKKDDVFSQKLHLKPQASK